MRPRSELLALLSVALAVVHRDRATLILAGAAVAWVIVEIAFALHGWPGCRGTCSRPAAAMVVVAAVGVGRLLDAAASAARAAGDRRARARGRGVVSLVPPRCQTRAAEHKDLVAQRARTKEIGQLTGVIGGSGGRRGFRVAASP